ncbi:MAG: hypothetical protein MUC29_10095 [Pyrinomonadaceae bacterium]|nr:hypothetical protein [Pyrinomonadaceae bacterium]
MEKQVLDRIKDNFTVGENRSVNGILYLFSVGRSDEQIFEVYPELEKEDLEVCRRYLARVNHIPTDSENFETSKNGDRPSSDFEWYAVDCVGKIARFTKYAFAAEGQPDTTQGYGAQRSQIYKPEIETAPRIPFRENTALHSSFHDIPSVQD